MNRIIIYLSFAALVLIASCAQQGSPTGGPKDVDPPKVISAVPENYSVNFDGKKILITFDEYLDMGNFAQELVVSPPMEEKPEVKLRNKTLIIEFEDQLKEDVTYTFNFGEGIKDLNEKNVLLNFEYVFATGDRLDSLSVKGTLKNAFDLTVPETPILVMLYTDLSDSIPITDIPYYVGRADENGNFAVNNLRSDVYKLFVLKDGNNNFLFDQPTEHIAYLDSSILVDANYFQKVLLESGKYDSTDLLADTSALAIDTVGMSADSVAYILDSLNQLKPDFNSIYMDLFMFTEDPVQQYISEYERKDRRILDMVFNIPLSDSFSYRPISSSIFRMSNLPLAEEIDVMGDSSARKVEITKDNFIEKFGVNRDSLRLFLSDTSVAALDSIYMELTYLVKDSMMLDIFRTDTLLFAFKDKAKKKSTKSESEEKEDKPKLKSLELNMIGNSAKQHIHVGMSIKTKYPIKEINPSLFEFYSIPDTIDIPMEINPIIDTMHLGRIHIFPEWEEEMSYRLKLFPGAIWDIYGSTNDTIDKKFTTRTSEDYGRLLLDLVNVEDTVIIQILEKDKIVAFRSVSTSEIHEFPFLMPGTYKIKLIHDSNGNGKWDTGKYLDHIQPEKVEFLPQEIELRANWDYEASYTIGSNTGIAQANKSEETDKTKSGDKEGKGMRSGGGSGPGLR